MTTGHGGKRANSGRKAGGANQKTREIADKASAEGITPLEYMLSVLRDKDAKPEDKRWAAEKAAPYLHPRLTAVDHSGEVKLRHEDALKALDE